MRFFIVLSCLFLLRSSVNGLPAQKNETSYEEETGNSSELSDETKSDSTEVTKNSSELDYVPVSLQHPLFKVFGINPDEYVVYYKYNRNQDNKLPPKMKLTEDDLMGKNEVMNRDLKNLHKKEFNRYYRQTLDSEEGEDVFDLEKDGKETLSEVKKRSYFLPPGYPAPQQFFYPPYSQFSPVYNPYQYPPFMCHPFPYCLPNGPYPVEHYPSCPHIPTCKQCPHHHPFKFTEHPETYKQLTGENLSVLSYPDEPRPGTPRAKRSYYKKIVH